MGLFELAPSGMDYEYVAEDWSFGWVAQLDALVATVAKCMTKSDA